MKTIKQIHDEIYKYLLDKNLLDIYTLGSSEEEIVVYEQKRSAMSKFYKKNLQKKFKKHLTLIRFLYIGKISIGGKTSG